MFPWLHQQEANWETIRNKLLSFVKNGTGMCNVHTTGGDELDKESKWKLAMIFGYGKPIDEVKSSFPVTLAIPTKLPEVQNAAFSLLKASRRVDSASLRLYRVHPSLSSRAHCTRRGKTLVANSRRSRCTVEGGARDFV